MTGLIEGLGAGQGPSACRTAEKDLISMQSVEANRDPDYTVQSIYMMYMNINSSWCTLWDNVHRLLM